MNKIHISGSGTVTPGQYDGVTISGTGKCPGNLRAEAIAISGSFRTEGNADCRRITINGSFRCDGHLSAEEVVCNGTATLDGDMVANALNVSGMLRCEGGHLRSENLTCTGILNADGAIVCGSMHVTGIIKATRIEGTAIRIRSHRPDLLRRFFSGAGLSKVEIIRGEELDLSGVTAEQVSGTNITIGPDCNIEHIAYSGTLSIHPSAVVGAVTEENS